MDIVVSFRHMEPTESLRHYAEEKVSKIKKYLDFPVEAHVVLAVDAARQSFADDRVVINNEDSYLSTLFLLVPDVHCQSWPVFGLSARSM